MFHQERTAKTELWVGLVCKINEETVDLGGFKSNGQPFSAVNVPLFDEPQDSPGDWAMWPLRVKPVTAANVSENETDVAFMPARRGRPPKTKEEGAE